MTSVTTATLSLANINAIIDSVYVNMEHGENEWTEEVDSLTMSGFEILECVCCRTQFTSILSFYPRTSMLQQLSLPWRHNEPDGVSNHQPHHCLLNCLFGRRSKKPPKLRATGLCAGNSPMTGELPAQMASNAENISIWWRPHDHAYTTYWEIAFGSST